MPVFWRPEELRRLRGTGLDGRSQADLPLLEDDFQALLVCTRADAAGWHADNVEVI